MTCSPTTPLYTTPPRFRFMKRILAKLQPIKKEPRGCSIDWGSWGTHDNKLGSSFGYIPTPSQDLKAHRQDYLILYSNMCIYIYIHIHINIHTYIHTYIRTCIYTYIHTYIHTYINQYTCMYIHTYTVRHWVVATHAVRYVKPFVFILSAGDSCR